MGGGHRWREQPAEVRSRGAAAAGEAELHQEDRRPAGRGVITLPRPSREEGMLQGALGTRTTKCVVVRGAGWLVLMVGSRRFTVVFSVVQQLAENVHEREGTGGKRGSGKGRRHLHVLKKIKLRWNFSFIKDVGQRLQPLHTLW